MAGIDQVLWREGDKGRGFHMKDVYRVDQKRTKGKRDGRLHVTLSPASGFYRYRLDFPDEAACARAADAMLEHRSYKAPTEIKLRVCSWNMGNALPQARPRRDAQCKMMPRTGTCTRTRARSHRGGCESRGALRPSAGGPRTVAGR